MNIEVFYKKFPSQKDCIALIEKVRWDGSPICPYCQAEYFTPFKNENRYKCNNCEMSFSVTVRTTFHKTKLDLQKWFFALVQVFDEPNTTARKLGEMIEVTKDTAWSMSNKIKASYINDKEFIDKLYKTLKQII